MNSEKSGNPEKDKNESSSAFVQDRDLFCNTSEREAYTQLVELLRRSPIPSKEILANLQLFLTRASLAHIFFIKEIYEKILNCHGIIMEFGTRWGRNISLFAALRNLYEPFNVTRKIVAFDTWTGFPSKSEKDGTYNSVQAGFLSTTNDYKEILNRIMMAQEKLSPRPHIKRYELLQGDVLETFPEYLGRNPHTIVALVYMDIDLYEPTREVLRSLANHMHRGTVIAFDELSLEQFPGETLAFKEVLGARNFKIIRNPYTAQQSYIVLDE